MKLQSKYADLVFNLLVAVAISLVVNFSYVLLMLVDLNSDSQPRPSDQRAVERPDEGVLSVHPDGYGYLVYENGDSVYVPTRRMRWLEIAPGDRIVADLMPPRSEKAHPMLAEIRTRNGAEFDYSKLYNGPSKMTELLLQLFYYLAVWIVTFSLLGLYLLGKIKFAHDSDMPYLGVGRLALAIVTFSLVVYLVPGMWGAPLKGLSGYLPPLHTQDFVIGQDGSGPAPAGGEARMLLTVDGQKPKHSDFLHLPHNLEGFFDLKEAEAYAAKVGKPLFIDFTGHGCVNCREMEARVWSDPQVLDILRNDYVIVALYSDDKKVLPESDWVTTDAGKVLKSLGKINSYYALKTYGVNAQPYYVLQGRNGKQLVPPRGYDLNVENFVQFLRSGVEAYKKQQ